MTIHRTFLGAVALLSLIAACNADSYDACFGE